MKCDHCGKKITDGQWHYNPDKKEEDKKFCTLYCMHQHYGEPCEECGKKTTPWFYSPEKNDGKKFCSDYCMQNYYRRSQDNDSPPPKSGGNKSPSPKSGEDKGSKNSSSSDFNWKKYQGLIIGVVIIIVLLIILGIIFGGKKKTKK